jgi:glycosyltransferase involved in cell wall biosynthesis
MKYILVTPARNESDNLPSLIKSVVNQSIKPELWLIMNDNSTDNSIEIIKEAAANYPYIFLINLDPAPYDLAWRYHEIMSNGFKKAIEMCKTKNIEWNFIGVLDSDIFLDSENYYQLLLRQLETDASLVIISGNVLSYNGNDYIEESPFRKEKPRGANRLIRKSFYKEIGYPIVPCADSVMRVLAIQKKYTCECVKNAIAKQSRLTTSERDDYRSGKYVGKVKYVLGYTLIYGLLKSIYFLLRLKPLMALGFLVSYIKCFVLREKRIDIEPVRKFYSKKVFGA